MPYRLASLIFLIFLASPARADVAARLDAEPVPTMSAPVNGLYPLWEQTGLLHRTGGVEVGYAHAQVGLGRVQLGTNPLLDLHGTLNLETKVALYRGERLHVALVAGAYHVPTAAESRTVGNLNATGFANPYAPVWLFPVSVAKSLVLGERFSVHWASTLLVARSPVAEHQHVSLGQTVLFEAAASPRWAARVHAGIEGYPVQTQAHAGLSIGYNGDHVFAAAGAARRFTFEGEAANLLLLDGGLRWP
jgi:hypothetical protein